MEKLKVKRPHTPEEAPNAPSLGLVYECPKCKVGHTLRHFLSEKVDCTKCKEVYQKP
jgi:uncharacterized protein (DUF983 family)